MTRGSLKLILLAELMISRFSEESDKKKKKKRKEERKGVIEEDTRSQPLASTHTCICTHIHSHPDAYMNTHIYFIAPQFRLQGATGTT